MRFKNLSYLNRKGPRYVEQRDDYACSAFALLNTDKWLGEKVTLKDLSKYKEMLGISKTSIPTIGSIAKYFKQKNINYFQWPKLRNLDTVLDNGGILYTLHIKYNKIDAHAFLITKRTEHGYQCVNLYKEHVISFVSRKQMASILRRKSKYTKMTSYAWPIYKKEEKNIATV